MRANARPGRAFLDSPGCVESIKLPDSGGITREKALFGPSQVWLGWVRRAPHARALLAVVSLGSRYRRFVSISYQYSIQKKVLAVHVPRLYGEIVWPEVPATLVPLFYSKTVYWQRCILYL